MILYDTKFLQLKSTKAKNGHDWFYAHRPNANDGVVILPIINNEKILFLIEERPPLIAEHKAHYSVGCPAGLVGDERIGESIEDAIKAELLEEAGLAANKIEIKTKKAASSPGCVTEVFHIAFAYIDNYKIVSEPISDGGIITDRVLVDIKNVYKWLKDRENEGMAISCQTLAALFYLFEDI